jgi:steroid 5-alpha reductase family enzyme
MGGVKRNVTSRFGKTDLFARRIVITIPRMGVFIIAGAIAIGLLKISEVLITAIALGVTVAALLVIVEARWQLRNFRYEMQERISSALADWVVPDDLPDLRQVDDELDDMINGKTTILRVPKR